MQETSYDLFSTVRACGGSHTLTIPSKKLMKVASECDPIVQNPVPAPVVTKNK